MSDSPPKRVPLKSEIVHRILSFCDRTTLYQTKNVSRGVNDMSTYFLRHGHADLQPNRFLKPMNFQCHSKHDYSDHDLKPVMNESVSILDVGYHGFEFAPCERTPLRFPNLVTLRLWLHHEKPEFCQFRLQDINTALESLGTNPNLKDPEVFGKLRTKLEGLACKSVAHLEHKTLVIPNARTLDLDIAVFPASNRFGQKATRVVQVVKPCACQTHLPSSPFDIPPNIEEIVLVFMVSPGESIKGNFWTEDYYEKVHVHLKGDPYNAHVHHLARRLCGVLERGLYFNHTVRFTICNIEVLDEPEVTDPLLIQSQSVVDGPPAPVESAEEFLKHELKGLREALFHDNAEGAPPGDVNDRLEFISFKQYLKRGWQDIWSFEEVKGWLNEV